MSWSQDPATEKVMHASSEVLRAQDHAEIEVAWDPTRVPAAGGIRLFEILGDIGREEAHVLQTR